MVLTVLGGVSDASPPFLVVSVTFASFGDPLLDRSTRSGRTDNEHGLDIFTLYLYLMVGDEVTPSSDPDSQISFRIFCIGWTHLGPKT